MIVSLTITMYPFLKIGNSSFVFAASEGTKAAMVNEANSCLGKKGSSLGLKGEWCAQFIYYCAKKSGNSSNIGSSATVGTMAKQTVNKKGGTITFVNYAAYKATKNRFKKSRVRYVPNYKPRKGDLYIQKGKDKGDKFFAHIGLVTKDSKKKSVITTIEGNTTCQDGKHSDFEYVEYKTRNKNKMSAPYGFTAFISPSYKDSVSYSWPTKSHTVAGYWGKESGHYYPYHYGIDIAASTGSNVYAAESGMIIQAGLAGGYGYCVIIRHDNGQCTLYGHNSKLVVKKHKNSKYNYVEKGQLIAKVGGTGKNGRIAYAPHCHFGIYKSQAALKKEDGRPASQITYNPLKYLSGSVSSKTYSVVYNANGGSGAPGKQTKKAGQALTLSSNKPTITGYTFTGWSTSASGSVVYRPGGKYTADKSITLYAVWKANTYTLKYNANGGTGSMADTIHTYGVQSNLRKNTFTREGFTFNNWNAKRSDGKWFYQKGEVLGWYNKGEQPEGYTLRVLNDGGWIVKMADKNNEVITLYAIWKKN